MYRFFTICLLLMPGWILAQRDSSFRLRSTVKGEIIDFNVDNLGNIYLVNSYGQIKKLNERGDSIAVFNDVRKGKPYSIDVTNPLKVLLYYREFGTVLVLDRFLNVRNTIDLRRLNLFQVRTVGQSYDNGIWIFDELEGKIKRISDEGRIVDQSSDFRQIFDSMPSPQYIVDQNKNLYLYDSLKGVYTFDYYGSFKGRIPFLGWDYFSVINSTILGNTRQVLYRYEQKTLNLEQYSTRYLGEARKIKITPNQLYLLRYNNILEIYTFLPPPKS